MLDFSYSVPPAWMAQEPGVAWGLASGFGGEPVCGADAHGALGLTDVAQSFARMWDEIDYGVLLLASDAQLLYANHVARHELGTRRALRMAGHALAAVQAGQQARFTGAVQAASLGKRALLEFGDSTCPLPVSFMPMAGSDSALHGGGQRSARVMAIMGKRQVCEALSFALFARLYGLSAAEANVLAAACQDLTADEIADQHGVAVSTVRTQLNQVRIKTGVRSIRQLISRVASLPPLVPAVKVAG